MLVLLFQLKQLKWKNDIKSVGSHRCYDIIKPLFNCQIAKEMKPATAAMSVFIGLNASGEELKLKKENIWAFSSNDASQTFEDYLKLDPEEALNADVPLVFISFPSAKDPNWATHPGKNCMVVNTQLTFICNLCSFYINSYQYAVVTLQSVIG